jgi:hypothetical protein
MNHPMLTTLSLSGTVTLPHPHPLSPSAPALAAMTDLRDGRPVTVSEDERLEAALARMIHAGVRLLFSTNATGQLTGVITASNIQGEKPVRFLASSDCLQNVCRWQDLRVRDIFTPVGAAPAASLASLRGASVADLRAWFEMTEHTHLLVAERRPSEGWCRCCAPAALSRPALCARRCPSCCAAF